MNNSVISIHLKIHKSNFFCVVSNGFGQVIFVKNSGNIGFSHLQKRSVEALDSLLEVSMKELLLLKQKNMFLKLEGLKVGYLKNVYKRFILFFKKNTLVLTGYKRVIKIPHNGCRFKK
jgi:ribosomal protein S11